MKVRFLSQFVVMMVVMLVTSMGFANTLTIGTGPKGLSWNTATFQQFNAALKQVSGNEWEAERFNEDGTPGTTDTFQMTNSGKYQGGFVQGGILAGGMGNSVAFGPFTYELFQSWTPPGHKKPLTCKAIAKMDGAYAMNTRGGTKVTLDAMGAVDKKFQRINAVHADNMGLARVIASGSHPQYQADALAYVSSVGGTVPKTLVSGGFSIGDCWDGNFDEFYVEMGKRKVQLYEKVTLKKKVAKSLGYDRKFTTFRIPDYFIVNMEVLTENPDLYGYIPAAIDIMYGQNKAKKGSKYIFPKKR